MYLALTSVFHKQNQSVIKQKPSNEGFEEQENDEENGCDVQQQTPNDIEMHCDGSNQTNLANAPELNDNN